MIYLTGDTHGKPDRIREIRRKLRGVLVASDTLIVLGDFGFLFSGSDEERAALDGIARMHVSLAFVDGNHENFPLLASFPEEDWHGGRVHRIRRNVVHLMRGQLYDIEGRSFFTFGGAYSLDRPWRTPGRSWWPEEMPSEAEYETARRTLAACGHRVDFILTHTAPEETMRHYHPTHPAERPLNAFLEWVAGSTDYGHWYIGHFHRDEALWRRQTVVYQDVVGVDGKKEERT